MKKNCCGFLILFLLIAGTEVLGQNLQVIDSLNRQLRLVPDTQKVDLFNQLSVIYLQRSYDTSLIYARHALDKSRDINDSHRIATSLTSLGNAYYFLGNYSESLNAYIETLESYGDFSDSLMIGKIYNNIGAIHLCTSDFDRALEYFTLSMGIMQQQGDTDMVASIQNNIGAIHYEKKEYERAQEYFLSSYRIWEKLSIPRQMSIALNNLGEAANYQNKYQEALDYYREAMNISSVLNDRSMLATLNANLGDLYYRMGQYGRSEQYLKKGLQLAQAGHYMRVQKDIYLKLSELYEIRSEFSRALDCYKRYSAYKDSMLSEEKQARIAGIEMQFKADAFQRQIDRAGIENILKSKLLKKQRIIMASLILVTLLILVVLFVSFKRHELKKRINLLLTEQNKKLNEANKRLQESEAHLKESNSAKDKFFTIIGHDLRNPLNALLGFSELISKNPREYTSEEIYSYINIINQSARNIHQLIENLLTWSRSQTGSLDFNPSEIDLRQLIAEIEQVYRILAHKKEISIASDIPLNTRVFADRDLLATIIRNLINNAIKFTPEKGRISIQAVHKDGFVEITVSDTGIGMSENQMKNLFRFESSYLSSGTSEEKGTGLGLILCKEFVDMHRGEIWVESEAGKGSSFHFTVLKNKDREHDKE